MTRPVLILQMQRLGDLILAFPLILDLLQSYPKQPIFVVAEEAFFRPLIPIAPPCTFFPPSFLAKAKALTYSLAFNLSSRPEAAQCLAQIKADAKFGPSIDDSGHYIHGFWQLYRHSLTQNNRHNTFHWADLYRLDLWQKQQAFTPKYTQPQYRNSTHVGLVLGASAPFKHPNAEFWITLGQILQRAGLNPFLIGGPKEALLGAAVAKGLKRPQANLCGKLSIGELSQLIKQFALCITPDTGPMHLANWLSVPVLNLSMGPVRAYETGPYAPKQRVLLPAISCAGCWSCTQQTYSCKRKFQPLFVAKHALNMLEQKLPPRLAELKLAHTCRDNLGLANLEFTDSAKPTCEQVLDQVWRNIFINFAAPAINTQTETHIATLKDLYPQVYNIIRRELNHILPVALKEFQRDKQLTTINWLKRAPAIRLLTGFLEMYLQNQNCEPHAWRQVCSYLAQTLSLFEEHE